MATHPNLGIPTTIHEVKTAPMDLPPQLDSHSQRDPEPRVVPLENLLEVLVRTGVSKRFGAAVVGLAVVILGVVAPTVEQGAGVLMGGLFGQDQARFDAIDAALEQARLEREKDRRALADLIRLVEAVEAEQARGLGRSPAKLSASLRAIVAADEME